MDAEVRVFVLVTPEIMVLLPGITTEPAMETTSATSKEQVTIPEPLRQQLGLHQGDKVDSKSDEE